MKKFQELFKKRISEFEKEKEEYEKIKTVKREEAEKAKSVFYILYGE